LAPEEQEPVQLHQQQEPQLGQVLCHALMLGCPAAWS
jgi:hypothetical protein